MAIKSDKAVKISQKHLLGIQDLSISDVNFILNEAKQFIKLNKSKNKKLDILKGKTQINLFFEPSTRTQSSFELAGKRLGADVMSMNIVNSAIKKGETLIDTAMTLNAMHPDLIVIRHQDSGACNLLSQKVNCSVINAGDGRREHPTQALLDALTIIEKKEKIQGLKIAICGDILHSRVARSNIYLLTMLGAEVNIISPTNLMPEDIEKFGVNKFSDMKKGLKDCDIVMMLRLQNERMTSSFLSSNREYYEYYGLTPDKLSYAKDDALNSELNNLILKEDSPFKNLYNEVIGFFKTYSQGIEVPQSLAKAFESTFKHNSLTASHTKEFWLVHLGLSSEESQVIYKNIVNDRSKKDIYIESNKEQYSELFQDIIDVEPQLTFLHYLFEYLLLQDGNTLDELEPKYLTILKTLQWKQKNNKKFPTSRMEDIEKIQDYRTLIEYHEKIMISRLQSPWLTLTSTDEISVRITKKGSNVESMLKIGLNNEWIHDYYITSMKSIKIGLES